MDEIDERLIKYFSGMSNAGTACAQAILDAAQRIAEALAPIIREIVALAKKFYVALQRDSFYSHLRRYRVPQRIASFLCLRWPIRWLPALGPPWVRGEV